MHEDGVLLRLGSKLGNMSRGGQRGGCKFGMVVGAEWEQPFERRFWTLTVALGIKVFPRAKGIIAV